MACAALEYRQTVCQEFDVLFVSFDPFSDPPSRSIEMEHTVSATDARTHFGELMRQVVEEDKQIIVERRGKSCIVILSIDAYQQLLQGQQHENWQDLVERARAQIRSDLAGRKLPSHDEILQQIREERDAQLGDLR
jgi:prevent-host-death family protein